MSLVYITEHDENIEDIERRLEETTADTIKDNYFKKHATNYRRPRPVVEKNFKKLSDGKILLTASKKFEHKTMGEAPKCKIQEPCNFLRKRQGVKWQREPMHKCAPSPGAPPLPKFLPQKKAEKPTINIIDRNIEKLKKTQVNYPRPRYIDTVVGTRQELINSGMIPQYICSKNFGKVPKYIKHFKKEFAELRERCLLADKQKEHDCMHYINAGLRQLTEEERKELLAGLTTNFTELTRNYQSMSLYTDTPTKKLRKGRVEKALTQVENDINLLKNYPVIYISNLE